MTYNKETRAELMQDEIIEDIQTEIREKAHEFNDGSLETFIDENRFDLTKEFMEDNNERFNDFCMERFNEVNSE